MEGYDVVTINDEKVGTIAGESGDFLIVEHGLLKKAQHALPPQQQNDYWLGYHHGRAAAKTCVTKHG